MVDFQLAQGFGLVHGFVAKDLGAGGLGSKESALTMPHELTSAMIFSFSLSMISGVRIGGGAFGAAFFGAGAFTLHGGVGGVSWHNFLAGGDFGGDVGSIGVGGCSERLPDWSNSGVSKVRLT